MPAPSILYYDALESYAWGLVVTPKAAESKAVKVLGGDIMYAALRTIKSTSSHLSMIQ